MGIIKRIFNKTPQRGNIYIKPSEVSSVNPKDMNYNPGQAGNVVVVGATGKTSTGGYVGGGKANVPTGNIHNIITGGSSIGGSSVGVQNTKQTEQMQKILQKIQKLGGKNISQQRLNRIVQQRKRQIINLKKVIINKNTGKFRGYKAVDFISGGLLTNKELRKEQERINKQVESYNKAFGGGPLEEEQYGQALARAEQIRNKQEELEQKQAKFLKSPKKKFGAFIYGQGALLNKYDIKKQATKTSKELKKIEKQIKSIESKKLTPIRNERLKTLKKLKTAANNELENLGLGKMPIVYEGQAASLIIPSATGISRVSKIKFIGKQRAVGNRIITDIAFVTNKGKRIGVARGITIQKGKQGYTVVGGRSAITKIKYTKEGKLYLKKLRKTQTFAGAEISKVKRTKFKLKDRLDLIRKNKKVKSTINIKKNISGLIQKSFGRIATVRGKKFYKTAVKFPTGRLFNIKARGINKDTFASISSILTKNDLNLIIGKTITAKGNKAKFIGLIKGEGNIESSGRGFSQIQKQQYQKALRKVLTIAAASISKTKQINGLTQKQKISIASNIIKNTIKSKSSSFSKILKSIKQKSISAMAQKSKTNARNKYISGSAVRQSQKLRSLQKQISKTKQQLKQIPIQNQGLRTKQMTKLRLLQKTLLKEKLILVNPRFALKGKTSKFMFPLSIFKRGKNIVRPKIPIKKQVFNVYGKSGKRFIKLNKKPLIKIDALSRGTYAIDHTTSRAFKLIPVGKKKKIGAISRVEKNYFNRAGYKLREYKIRGGRKFIIKPKYIEKRKYGLDTSGEKRQLSIARFIKKNLNRGTFNYKRRQVIKRNSRRLSSSQRKIMLKNLVKARLC